MKTIYFKGTSYFFGLATILSTGLSLEAATGNFVLKYSETGQTKSVHSSPAIISVLATESRSLGILLSDFEGDVSGVVFDYNRMGAPLSTTIGKLRQLVQKDFFIDEEKPFSPTGNKWGKVPPLELTEGEHLLIARPYRLVQGQREFLANQKREYRIRVVFNSSNPTPPTLPPPPPAAPTKPDCFDFSLSASGSSASNNVPSENPYASVIIPERLNERLAAAATQPRPKVLFTGSSTPAMWGGRIYSDFPGLPLVNTARGGTTYRWLLENVFEKVIFPYSDGFAVFYSGSNDQGAASPETIVSNLRSVIGIAHHYLPRLKFVILSVHPKGGLNPAQLDKIKRTNCLLKRMADPELAADNCGLTTEPETTGACMQFVDSFSRFYAGGYSEPYINTNLFLADQLHPSQAGYDILAELLRPILMHP